MKINNFYVYILFSFFLISCASEIRTFDIKIYTKAPFSGNSTESNQIIGNQIKAYIPKFEIDGTQYVCRSAEFIRLDLDSIGQLRTKHTLANEIKIKMGVELSPEDLLNDYQDSNNVIFPAILSLPKLDSKVPFPFDCHVIHDIDSLKLLIQEHSKSGNHDKSIKIGIAMDYPENSETILPKNPNTEQNPTQSILPEIENTDAINKPSQTEINLPKLRINLEVSEDQREITWYNNSKKNEHPISYEIMIFKNNRQILTKKNITSNKISCSELNSSRLLNTDCEYKLQINALRTFDGMIHTETYDIELQSPDKFNPRCHLNLLNE
jgi:hypothetical protein